MKQLALLYHSPSKFATAERLCQRTLAVAERASGTDRDEIASIINNLAGLYTEQQKSSQAEPLYLKSLALVGERCGPVPPKVNTRRMLLSHFYRIQGKGFGTEGIPRRLIG